MDGKEATEIPFGAFDSELKGWEYTIPEGMEAEIKDGKIIVREKESEDERIRKEIISYIKASGAVTNPNWITWLEKQGNKEEINEASYRTGIKRVLDNPESYGLEKQGSQKPANSAKTCKDGQNCAWSEEDDVRLTSTIQVLRFAFSLDSFNQYGKKDIKDNLTWLESLKSRAQSQPKSEWGEEDEEMFEDICSNTEFAITKRPSLSKELGEEQLRWLKSFKERCTWKPSDEQMEAFEQALHLFVFPNMKRKEAFEALFNDLKKLKG